MVIKTSDPLNVDTVPNTTKCFTCKRKCVNKTPLIYNLLILILFTYHNKKKKNIQTCEVDFHRGVYSKIKCPSILTSKPFVFRAKKKAAYFHFIHAFGNGRRSYAREPIAKRTVRL